MAARGQIYVKYDDFSTSCTIGARTHAHTHTHMDTRTHTHTYIHTHAHNRQIQSFNRI